MLAEGLAARGHHVTVLVTNTARQRSIDVCNGVRVIRAGRTWHVASTPLSPDLLQQAHRLEADLINLHMPYPPGDLAARAIRGSPPLIVTYHSDVVRQLRLLQVYKPLLHATLRRATRIIATSAPYIASSPFLRRYAAKCRVVPLSVAADRFAAAPPDAVAKLRRRFSASPSDCIVLAVGVLRYYKGLDILIHTMTQIEGSLVIVGAGPEEQRLRDLTQAFGIAQRVHFAGRVSDADLPTYYHAADVFVLPSQLRAEAFGIVQLEAMAAGIPVISTELGTGTSVANQHGVTGFVVPPADPHALATALRVLLANPDLRQRMGAQALQRVVSEYTPAQMIDRTLTVYAEAVAEHKQAHR